MTEYAEGGSIKPIEGNDPDLVQAFISPGGEMPMSFEEAVDFLNNYVARTYRARVEAQLAARTPEQKAADEAWERERVERLARTKAKHEKRLERHAELVASEDPVVRAVAGLHSPDEERDDECAGCDWDCVEYAGLSPWPCPTWKLVADLDPFFQVRCYGHVDPVVGYYRRTHFEVHDISISQAKLVLAELSLEDFEDGPRCLLDVIEDCDETD